MAVFLNHLQFVYPTDLEGIFNQYLFEYGNRSIDKIDSVFRQTSDIKQYKKLAKQLSMTRMLGLDLLVIELLRTARLYPSVLYAIRKRVS